MSKASMVRLMVVAWLFMAPLLAVALEPEVEAAPSLDAEGAALMSRSMAARDERAMAVAVASFTSRLESGPFWLANGRLAALLTALDEVATDGLAPADYGVERLRDWLQTGGASPEMEMLATRGYLLALLHLYRGKVDPAALDPHWNFTSNQQGVGELWAKASEAAESGQLAGVFSYARPARQEYNGLRSALARLRGLAMEGGWPMLPAGKSLKPGMTDPRVVILRTRLQIAGLATYIPQGVPAFFDDELAKAVIRFQREAYLTADGSVGPQTVNALNIPVRDRIDQIRANLERMRWVRDMGKGPMVVVDIAGFRIAYIKDGRAVWRSRVQVGRAYRSTPVFRASITHLTLNPTWTVPPTIMDKDVLPAIRKNRNYLKKHRMRVFTADGRAIAASAVNWWRPGNIILRQDAGEKNSLGELAIRFPNPYAVYLHDTPHKELFDSNQRAFSSGCIRVENVHELAVLLMDDAVQWDRNGLDAAISEGKTRQVNLVTPIPILLAYWTVDIAPDGYVAFKMDIYERDRPLVAALNRLVLM